MPIADVDAVLGTLRELDLAAHPDDLMAQTLRGLADLIPNDMASFNWMTTGSVSAMLRPEIASAEFDRLNAVLIQHWHENPLARHFERTGDTRALTWTDVEVDPSWRDGALYQGLYVPLGVTQQMVVRLPSPPGTVAGLALNRTREPFDQRDRDLLTLVGRQIGAMLGSTSERTAMRTMLNQQGWRSMLADDHGRIIDGPVGTDSEHDEIASIIRTILRRTVGDRRGGRLAPTDPEDVEWQGARVAVVVAPAAVPPHVVFVRPAGTIRRAVADTSSLASLGLSPRERQVAAQLSTGATNQQIAETLSISVGTVKKHLQRIFVALDAETRTAAAAIVVRHLR
ncbi:MAG: response regulator transcription factor [Acidimicrobiales bacterium]